MVCLELEGRIEAVNAFLRKLKGLFLAGSLRDVASLAEHPTTMSHDPMSQNHRRKVGITDELVRSSVGLENMDDLIEDRERALIV
jgi:cystathionine beta-lyase/cystathionine gamma-synthase